MNFNSTGLPTLTELRAVFDVDTARGLVFWRVKRNGYAGGVKPGDPAGYVVNVPHSRHHGRTVIRYKGRAYMRAWLVWLFATGSWHTQELDHINRDSSDDRFENLRDVSRMLNAQNTQRTKNSKTGEYGIYWNTSHQKYHIEFRRNNKRIRGKFYNSIADAIPERDKLLNEF